MDTKNIPQVRIIEQGTLCPQCSREGQIIHEDSRGQILFCLNLTCRTMEFCNSFDTKYNIVGKKKEREEQPNKTLDEITYLENKFG